jgi:hypothetical protein
MAKCETCGSKFDTPELLKKATDKALAKLIKQVFWLSQNGTLFRFRKNGECKEVGTKCGQVTLPGGRRVQLRRVMEVLTESKKK